MTINSSWLNRRFFNENMVNAVFGLLSPEVIPRSWHSDILVVDTD